VYSLAHYLANNIIYDDQIKQDSDAGIDGMYRISTYPRRYRTIHFTSDKCSLKIRT
jgi:hypothetical protein